MLLHLWALPYWCLVWFYCRLPEPAKSRMRDFLIPKVWQMPLSSWLSVEELLLSSFIPSDILLGFEMEASPWVYFVVVAAKYHLFWVDCAFSSLQVLKHLTLKRPVEASRMDFFAHAEAFAALVLLEFVSISGKPACSSCLFLALQM